MQEKENLWVALLEALTDLKEIRNEQKNEIEEEKEKTRKKIMEVEEKKIVEEKDQTTHKMESKKADPLKMDTKTTISKGNVSVDTKFELVSKILSAQPQSNQGLLEFKELLHKDFMEYANKVEALDREAEAVVRLQRIEKELETLVNFPIIATKNIIAIGGGFSSGKSAFINSFIENKNIKLPMGIKPVTAIPTYVAASMDNVIQCFSNTGGAIEIDEQLNNNLSHDFINSFGFNLKSIMPYMTIGTKLEQLSNICFVDTPGYNPVNIENSTDEDINIAKEYLEKASVLLWVIGLDSNGTISATDIDFLSNIHLENKKLYIVLNKADLKAESDIEEVMDEIEETLEDYDIDYDGMSAYSSNRNREYLFRKKSLFDFLKIQNSEKNPFKNKINQEIKDVLNMYREAIEEDIEEIKNIQKQFKSLVLDLLEVDYEDSESKVSNRINELKKSFNPLLLKEQLTELKKLESRFERAIEDIFKDIVNDFDFGNKTICGIKEGIEATDQLSGIDGSIDKYGYGESLEIEIKAILKIEKGQTKLFKNAIVHFQSYINCSGTLIFENCIVNYNESDVSDEITLNKGGIIKFINCKIECKKIDQSFFIQGEDENEIVIQNCDLVNCSYFMDIKNSKMLMDQCNLINPFLNFFQVLAGESIISNCYINLKKMTKQQKKIFEENSWEAIFLSETDDIYDHDDYGHSSFSIINCIVQGEEIIEKLEDINDMVIFNLGNAIYENCSFNKVNNCISNGAEVKACNFIKCKEVISDFGAYVETKKQKITECLFDESESIITADHDTVNISKCQFINCKNRIIEGSGSQNNCIIEFCEFVNTSTDEDSSFYFSRFRSEEQPSVVKKCLFNGVNLCENSYLFVGKVYDEITPAVCIKDCEFRNCVTKNTSGKLFEKMGWYLNFSKRWKYIQTLEIENCKGLDKINKANSYTEDFIIKTETATGKLIGARLDDNIGSTML